MSQRLQTVRVGGLPDTRRTRPHADQGAVRAHPRNHQGAVRAHPRDHQNQAYESHLWRQSFECPPDRDPAFQWRGPLDGLYPCVDPASEKATKSFVNKEISQSRKEEVCTAHSF